MPSNTSPSQGSRSPIWIALVAAIVVGALVWVLKPSSTTPGPNNPVNPTASAYGFEKGSKKLQVGFITVGPTSDWGYNYQHNQGRLFMQANLGDKVHTVIAENIPENAEVERVMQRMIDEGAQMIYSTSYGYADMAMKVAEKNPSVKIMQALGTKQAANLGTYSLNVWEPAYVAGVVAAMTSKHNKHFGFLGAQPIPPIYWTVDAFALGARSVDPSITVDIVFTNSWNDPAAETAAVKSLASKGVGLVYVLVDSPIAGVQEAERDGIFALAHFADLSSFAPKEWVTGAAWQWGPLYLKETQSVLDGTWTKDHKSGGFNVGYVALAPFGPAVPADAQAKARELESQIASGKLNVFAGPISDSTGKQRVPAGKALTVPDILSLDWAVQGIQGAPSSK